MAKSTVEVRLTVLSNNHFWHPVFGISNLKKNSTPPKSLPNVQYFAGLSWVSVKTTKIGHVKFLLFSIEANWANELGNKMGGKVALL